MPSLKLRRPSPAFVLAAIALFAALGGTGYAATRPESAPASAAKKAAKPLKKPQIEKLIAGYVGAHKAELRGPAGSPGAPGAAGVGTPGPRGLEGPQGPGAIPIVANVSAAESGEKRTFGPWSATLTCSGNAPNATITIHGPGVIGGSTEIASGNNPGSTFVGQTVQIGSGGVTAEVNSGAQLSQTDFLRSEGTMYELQFVEAASVGAPLEECSVMGDAIPVS